MLRVQEMEEAWALTVISHTAPSHSQLQLLSYDKAVSCDNYFRPFRTSFIEIHTPDRERLCSIGTEGTCRCVRLRGDNINNFLQHCHTFSLTTLRSAQVAETAPTTLSGRYNLASLC